jgi:hydroxymethylglutaryl-CoA lyase
MRPVAQRVKVVEVGPRDGLQNEAGVVPTELKIELIDRLGACGLPVIETTSFVRADRVPQLADAEAVYAGIEQRPGVAYPALVPNSTGLQRALAAGVRDIAVFTAASETFCRRNINCSVQESLHRFEPIVRRAGDAGVATRAYVSCVLGCPYEGAVPVATVVDVAKSLWAMGCTEISLGDTIGAGTPLAARALVAAVADEVPLRALAVHLHDTRGQALAGILACLELGVATVDCSVAGLGGCPYAPGASGNVATEDVAYMLKGMGVETGIDLDALVETGHFISQALGRNNESRVGRAAAALARNR